jgi:hypothetical protein
MEEKKNSILAKFTPGNIITITAIIAGVIMTYAKIQDHLTDQNIHFDEKTQVILTTEEYKNLIKFSSTAEKEMPKIQQNTDRIIEIEKSQAVHKREYEFLLQEESDLEDKVSRIYKELKEEHDK